MNIEDMEMVANFRKQRENLIKLRRYAGGEPGALEMPLLVSIDGPEGRIEVLDWLSEDVVRQTIIETASDAIHGLETQLVAMGVSVKVEPRPIRDAASWRRDCEMYARAWLRELGGKLIPKAHFIDALVLTTRQLREKAKEAGKTTVMVIDWREPEPPKNGERSVPRFTEGAAK